jgi:hypothetical protein
MLQRFLKFKKSLDQRIIILLSIVLSTTIFFVNHVYVLIFFLFVDIFLFKFAKTIIKSDIKIFFLINLLAMPAIYLYLKLFYFVIFLLINFFTVIVQLLNLMTQPAISEGIESLRKRMKWIISYVSYNLRLT